MSEQKKQAQLCAGLVAHVDAGKTTLSEAMLYTSGVRRTLGRVDHGDAFLDTFAMERARGITIFSKQAILPWADAEITLVDTPGHVDFAGEAERVMPILDCAVLVISGSEGVQAHTLTLWKLLEHYNVPTVVFVNKMDLAGAEETQRLMQLRQLSPLCVRADEESLMEAAAMGSEVLLEAYLSTGAVPKEAIAQAIRQRRIVPVCFGSALRMIGVEQVLDLLALTAKPAEECDRCRYRVFKISRDSQGNRMTWVKILSGTLSAKDSVSYVNQKGDALTEKVQQLRRYSGERFTQVDSASAGQTVTIIGLSASFIGLTFGSEQNASDTVLEPVMSYRVGLPKGTDPLDALGKLRMLEEEEPLLSLDWENGAIFVRMMGKVQCETFRELVKERFNLEITLESGRIFYKETITDTVEGVGHYEPLRHYAEVHLLLEPGEPGSGIQIRSACPADSLDGNFQNLILTHLREKTHRGVLTGAPLTDVKITLMSGRAHLKHTEGGDFRQATYRAVRQGLMQASSRLLEPWYTFRMTLPTEYIGRAITDIRAMSGEFEAPEAIGSESLLTGRVAAAKLGDYAQTLAAYTQGRGRLQLTPAGFLPCHNQEEVVKALGYDPEADLANTPDSVFCAHGAGFTVKWSEVMNFMHLESILRPEKQAQVAQRNRPIEDQELEAIMDREFGPIRRPQYGKPAQSQTREVVIREMKPNYLIVDGYNVLFAWPEAALLAKSDLEAARRMLMDDLAGFAAFRKWEVLLVFDGYKVPGNLGEKLDYHGIRVVFTKENETGDSYIESLAAQIGSSYQVRVATSDALVQISSLRSGVLRMPARELLSEIADSKVKMREYYHR